MRSDRPHPNYATDSAGTPFNSADYAPGFDGVIRPRSEKDRMRLAVDFLRLAMVTQDHSLMSFIDSHTDDSVALKEIAALMDVKDDTTPVGPHHVAYIILDKFSDAAFMGLTKDDREALFEKMLVTFDEHAPRLNGLIIDPYRETCMRLLAFTNLSDELRDEVVAREQTFMDMLKVLLSPSVNMQFTDAFLHAFKEAYDLNAPLQLTSIDDPNYKAIAYFQPKANGSLCVTFNTAQAEHFSNIAGYAHILGHECAHAFSCVRLKNLRGSDRLAILQHSMDYYTSDDAKIYQNHTEELLAELIGLRLADRIMREIYHKPLPEDIYRCSIKSYPKLAHEPLLEDIKNHNALKMPDIRGTLRADPRGRIAGYHPASPRGRG